MLNTQRWVNKVSRPILLLLFFSLSFEFYLPIFFDCLFVNVYQHYPSWMSGYQCPQSKVVFFTWNFTCNLTSWLELLFSQIHNSITVWCFALCFFLRHDCVHKSFNFNIHLRLQKTSETSKSFENNILSRAIGLVKVFNAILTCMQTCEKLQCLYEKQMSSNFHKTAVLKKISIYCKLKLQSKGLS